MHSKLYRVSPSVITDLVGVVRANIAISNSPVVVHSVGMDDDGNYMVQVVGYGPNANYARLLCESAERNFALLLPARNKDSKHIASPGERLEFTGNLYHVGAYIHPNYGTQFIHRIETDDGNEITWNTSRIHPLGRYKVSCRVKEHLVYSKVNQTAVTHCKFETEE
jgi:hypothetical protein